MDARARTNPFPGLRPFMQEEADLFFGCDKQSDELVRRLAGRRFLAVVGTSGSGKSSLVRAGLLPSLEGGFMAEAGAHWRMAILRPQDDPIGFMARAIVETGALAHLDLAQSAMKCLSILDSDVQILLQAEFAAATRTPALRPCVLDPQPDLALRFGYWRQLSALPRRSRRSLQRRWKRSVGALALLYAVGQAQALAQTIVVDGSTCTLADAITAANTDAATGGCTAGSGSDTLVLAPGSTHILTTVQDTQDAPTGLPRITSAITIAGNGSTITRASDAPRFRIVAVASTGNLTLGETTVIGGVTVGSQFPANAGGGVLNRGTLRLLSSTVVNNVASDGGGVFNDRFASLSLTNSTVSGNLAINDGGGVFNHTEGTLIVSSSTVSDNLAGGEGGGVQNSGGLTLIQTLVSGNTSPQGPEVHNVLGPTGTVASDNFNLFGHDASAGIVGFTPGATDVVPSQPLTDILDSMLAGGTHALVFGSPAIDAVPAVSCATATDQRGVLRPFDGNGDGVPDCDIGAFEFTPPAPAPPTPTPTASVCNSPACFPDIIMRGAN